MSLPAQNLTPARGGQSPAAQSSVPGAPTPPGGGPSRPTYSKRGKITIVACVNCRRRKTKCDGQRPTCSQCRARDGTQCHYDMNEEQRRLTYLRENVEQLHEEKNSLEALINNLRVSSEEEAIEILRRLRHGTDAQSLSQSVASARVLAGVSRPGAEGSPAFPMPNGDSYAQLTSVIAQTGPNETSEIIRRIKLREDPNAILHAVHSGTLMAPLEKSGSYSRPDQAFGLTRISSGIPVDSEFNSPPRGQATHQQLPLHGNRSTEWMNAPDTQMDHDIIDQSLGLYFSWQHCFFQSFPENLFGQDMASGSTKYCSRLLVNAVSAAGCLLSPWEHLPGGAQRPQELSKFFIDEATRELSAIEEPDIPTIAGLIILAQLEGKRGRMHQAWDYCGRSARLALDAGLHLKDDRQDIDPVESNARDHAFWGCFIADQLTSFTLGRIPQIPVTAITIDLPAIVEADDIAPWDSFGDGRHSKAPGGRSTTFHEVASLSKILNSTLYLFFAPSQTLKGSLLLDEYNKYRTWYAQLPKIVQLSDDAAPHVFTLHMYYHAAILLLFRPFLKAKFTQSDISPHDLCRASAAAISQIFDQHRRLYDSIGIYTLQIHCLLAACSVHIINTPAIASTQYLTSAAHHFHDLAGLNSWAAESINILKDLVAKWGIVLPLEAEAALYNNNDAPNDDPSNPNKRAAFSSPTQPPKKQPKLSTPRMISQASTASSVDRALFPSLLPTDSTASAGSQSQLAPYLFAPFPNATPMLAPTHTSNLLEKTIQTQMSGLNATLNEFDGMTFDLNMGPGLGGEMGGGGGWWDSFMGFDPATGVGAEGGAGKA